MEQVGGGCASRMRAGASHVQPELLRCCCWWLVCRPPATHPVCHLGLLLPRLAAHSPDSAALLVVLAGGRGGGAPAGHSLTALLRIAPHFTVTSHPSFVLVGGRGSDVPAGQSAARRCAVQPRRPGGRSQRRDAGRKPDRAAPAGLGASCNQMGGKAGSGVAAAGRSW